MPTTADETGTSECDRRARTPGVVFSGDRLLIFRPDEIMRIRGWPDPDAVLREDAVERWRPFVPTFPLVRPYRRRAAPRVRRTPSVSSANAGQLEFELELPDVRPPARPRRRSAAEWRRLAFDRFRFSLPRAVAAALERFPSHHWRLLVLLHGFGDAALDLARSRPVLAYLAANDPRTQGYSRPRTESLLSLRQRELAAELGFPDAKAVVRILAKIHPGTFDPTKGRLLRRLLRHEGLRTALGHLPEIHGGVFALLEDGETIRRCTPRLLLDVANDPGERHRQQAARRLREIVELERRVGDDRSPERFQSVKRLDEVHDDLVRRLRQLELRRRAATVSAPGARFPPPPLAGTTTIVPLLTPEALAEEGRLQGNCVACYADRVRRGRCFIYRVLAPQRCTLAITRDSGGNWRRDELETAGNRPADERTARAVDRWLAEHRLGA